MNVKTAARILDIFEAFAMAKKPLTLSEISSSLSIPVSSCFALLRTLENRGYIHTIASRHEMYPTRRIFKLAQQIAEHDSISEELQLALENLSKKTGETVVLGKLEKDEVVYIDVYESSHSIRYNTEIGQRRVLYCTSSGKSFLGLLDDKKLKEKIAEFELKPFTSKTETSAERLFAEIVESRDKKGWFINVGETVEDLMGIATTIHVSGIYYCISVVGPVYRMQPNLDELTGFLMDTKKITNLQ